MKQTFKFLLIGLLTTTGCAGQRQMPDPLRPPVTALPVADPASVHINPDSISNLVRLIRSTPPADLRGLVILKDHKLVTEAYFYSFWRESIEDIRSAGKSITALLLGIAIDKGLVKSPEQSIYDFFPSPEYIQPANDKIEVLSVQRLLNFSVQAD